MKIQIASDLHLEWVEHQFPEAAQVSVSPEAELLILAGDIHSGTRALPVLAGLSVPVVYVAGNHESYGCHLHGLIDLTRTQADELGLHYLEMRSLELPGVRILGATLWTDYALYGDEATAMAIAGAKLADHRYIQGRDGLFTPEQAKARHDSSLQWLKAHLSKPFEGKTVVVTHHGPHPAGVEPQYQGDGLTPAFHSDLRALMPQVDLWVHGHVHSSVDIQEGRCRVIANPRGYPRNLRFAACAQDLVFENPRFQEHLVIDL